MPHYHPERPEDRDLRNALLQKCLRPEPLPFPIEEEYPLVLSATETRFSYCMKNGDKLCSHANLWPRRVLDPKGQEKFRIGLVGNVATDPLMQGQGLMRQLLAELTEVARSEKLDALLLWSDLSQFYHKLGFHAVGKEFHFSFKARAGVGVLDPEVKLNPVLTPKLLEKLMGMRVQVPLTLERSPDEFQRMLAIPWLDLFVLEKGGRILGYAISGKGYDMLGVIHEWAVEDIRDLSLLVNNVSRYLEMEKLLLLAPGNMDEAWAKGVTTLAHARETHPMALLKIINDTLTPTDFAGLFVWGPDSI